MRVLLPPSEAKNPGGRGRPLRSRAAHRSLGVAREQALTALEVLLARPRAVAAAALALPPGTIEAALARNAQVRDSPTMPALSRYAGVVYDGLTSVRLDEVEHRLAARSILVFSGLFGVVRGDEAVPAYRVPAKAVLPDLGVASTFWRPVLDEAMAAMVGTGLIIDLRSTDYAAMWRPPRAFADRVVTVRVLSPLPSGALGVVSYPSKFAKGRLAGSLIRRSARGAPVDGADDVAAAWLDSGGPRAEPDGPHRVVIHTA